MLKHFILYCISFFLFILMGANAGAQNTLDCVHLHNGTVIKGIIVEQIPGESIKIKTADGSLFVFKMSEVSDIKKEQIQNPFASQRTQMSAYAGALSWEYRNKRVVVDTELKKDLSGMDLKRLLGEADYVRFSNAQGKYAAGKRCMNAFYWSTGIFVVSGAIAFYGALKLEEEWALLPGIIAAGAELSAIINLAIGLSWTIKSKKTLNAMVSDYNSAQAAYSFSPVLQLSPAVTVIPHLSSGGYVPIPGIRVGMTF